MGKREKQEMNSQRKLGIMALGTLSIAILVIAILPTATNTVDAAKFALAVEDKTKGCMDVLDINGDFSTYKLLAQFVIPIGSLFKNDTTTDTHIDQLSVGGFSINSTHLIAKNLVLGATATIYDTTWNNKTQKTIRTKMNMKVIGAASLTSFILKRSPDSIYARVSGVWISINVMAYNSTSFTRPPPYSATLSSNLSDASITFSCRLGGESASPNFSIVRD